MKMWEVWVDGILKYKSLFGKEKEEISGGHNIRVMAETKEEAIKIAEEKYNKFQQDTNSLWRFCSAYYVTSWDDWSVEKAMRMLNGKEFAEYAKQNGLTSLFN